MGRGWRSRNAARGQARPSGTAACAWVTGEIGARAATAGAGGAQPSQVGPQQLQQAPPGMPAW